MRQNQQLGLLAFDFIYSQSDDTGQEFLEPHFWEVDLELLVLPLPELLGHSFAPLLVNGNITNGPSDTFFGARTVAYYCQRGGSDVEHLELLVSCM